MVQFNCSSLDYVVKWYTQSMIHSDASVAAHHVFHNNLVKHDIQTNDNVLQLYIEKEKCKKKMDQVLTCILPRMTTRVNTTKGDDTMKYY